MELLVVDDGTSVLGAVQRDGFDLVDCEANGWKAGCALKDRDRHIRAASYLCCAGTRQYSANASVGICSEPTSQDGDPTHIARHRAREASCEVLK